MKKSHLPEHFELHLMDDTPFLARYDYEPEQRESRYEPSIPADAMITEVSFDEGVWILPDAYLSDEQINFYNTLVLDKIIALEVEHYYFSAKSWED